MECRSNDYLWDMNQIPIIKANILQTDADFLLHGCNCQASMSGGLARFIAEKWPVVEIEDETVFNYLPVSEMIGSYSTAQVHSDSGKLITVVNLYTQINPGPDFRISAMEKSITSFLAATHHVTDESTFALPKIGCGIGGGNWDEVYPLLCKLFEGRKATIYTVD